MALSDEGHGTVTLVIGAETTLADILTAKTFVGFVDLTNMQAGDTLEVNIYTKVLTGGAAHSLYYQQFLGVQTVGNIVLVTLPVPSLFEWKFTLKQTAGTGRAYDWTAVSL